MDTNKSYCTVQVPEAEMERTHGQSGLLFTLSEIGFTFLIWWLFKL